MLSKRIFWLTCAAIASWLIWMRLRQRHDEFATTIPQFAPPRTFAPPAPAARPTRQPDSSDEPAFLPALAPQTNDTALATAESADLTADSPEAEVVAEAADQPAADVTVEAVNPSEAEVVAEAADPEVVAEAADQPAADDLAEAEVSGYCMRCKTKRPIQNAHRETTESGRPAARGTCPICGANMFTFLATDDDT